MNQHEKARKDALVHVDHVRSKIGWFLISLPPAPDHEIPSSMQGARSLIFDGDQAETSEISNGGKKLRMKVI